MDRTGETNGVRWTVIELRDYVQVDLHGGPVDRIYAVHREEAPAIIAALTAATAKDDAHRAKQKPERVTVGWRVRSGVWYSAGRGNSAVVPKPLAHLYRSREDALADVKEWNRNNWQPRLVRVTRKAGR